DITHMEQYLDFLRNRMFRCSLLCHAEANPERTVQHERLLDCFVAAPLTPERGGDFEVAEAAAFVHPTESRITVTPPLQQAALWLLGRDWPRQYTLDALAVEARERIGGETSDDDRAEVADIVLEALAGDLVEVRLSAQRFCVDVSERPLGCPLAQLMARDGYHVTNRRHETVVLTSIARQTLLLLDGQRDHAAIATALCALVADGEMTITRGDRAIAETAEVAETVDEALSQVLEDLGRRALLID
ncbi:MAG: hypothetical protein AAGD86_04705, partial [Pseudomonadota bacterium]